MKLYSEKEFDELLKQAMDLDVLLYDTTTVGEIETLVKHKLLNLYGKEIPKY